MPSRSVWQFVLPGVVCLLMLLGASGCMEIPTFEHPADGEEHRDFTNMVGQAGSTKEFRPQAITFEKTVALLGKPDYASEDGNTIGYSLVNVRSVLLYGGGAIPWERRVYLLRLQFVNSLLSQPDLIHRDTNNYWSMLDEHDDPPVEPIRIGLLSEINKTGPEMFPTDPVRRAEFLRSSSRPTTNP